MNYEEKYKEALERAKKLHDSYNLMHISVDEIEQIFPELTESEEERIRKFLVDFFASYKIGDAETKLNGVRIDDILAYLEKQKEQDKCPEFCNGHCVGCEKQKEQKPAESISQLTVQGKGVYKICPRCKERMVRDDSMVYTSMPPQYRYECPKCGESECDTVMYDNPEMEEQKPNFSEKDSTDFEIEVHEIIAQARNDSRLDDADVLKQFEEEAAFALMLKANKLIEQKPEWSEEDERIREALVWHLKADVDFVSNGVTKAECLAYLDKQKAQKQEWSEEDENARQNLIAHFEGKVLRLSDEAKKEAVDWLKSLRPSWKPSEEQMKALIDCTIGNEYDVHALVRLWAELKKL